MLITFVPHYLLHLSLYFLLLPSLLRYRFKPDSPLSRYSFGTLISSLYSLVLCAITFKRTYTSTLIPTPAISLLLLCNLPGVASPSLLFSFFATNVTYLSCRRFSANRCKFCRNTFTLHVRIHTFSAVGRLSYTPYCKFHIHTPHTQRSFPFLGTTQKHRRTLEFSVLIDFTYFVPFWTYKNGVNEPTNVKY